LGDDAHLGHRRQVLALTEAKLLHQVLGDLRVLGARETGSRAALPIFREIMLRLYRDRLVGPVPQFPSELEARIDAYLASRVSPLVSGIALAGADR
jgi:hypothetical protein